ncbi:glycosyltransferase [Paenibacillus enshidis]|uniref:Glycosyltransferase n=1 Tax=Paenibacillus enshidis TaxID=1458439 RepID=A0ABV5B1V8_9BACL
MNFMNPVASSALYHCGEETVLEAGHFIFHPDEVSIGSYVHIRSGHWFSVISKGRGRTPVIRIGDGCICGENMTISALNSVELESGVRIGRQVSISDTDHEYQEIGKAILAQGINDHHGALSIGEGAIIEDNCVIHGNLRIGRGAIIRSGSVVEQPIPDHCIAAGNPAEIIKVFNYKTAEWLSPQSAAEREQMLRERFDGPFLSICIPTYNRSANLEACLQSIVSQLHSCYVPVEVLISDNASTDNTAEVAAKFSALYPYITYYRNDENIGADRNIFKIMNMAKGTFIKLQGDDDFFVEGTLMPLIYTIQQHQDCGVIHIHVHNHDGKVFNGEGASAFLRASTIMSTFISGTILRRTDLGRIEEPDLFINTSFNQMYIQYAILQKNPLFCVIHRGLFRYANNPPSGYNFGEVVFRGYQKILRYFIGKGLTEEDVSAEKKHSLFKYILPWYHDLVLKQSPTDLSGFEELFTEHFREEPYYEEVLQFIQQLKPSGSMP